MGRTKRQHYVPQSYLRRFSIDGTRLHTYLIKSDTPCTLDEEELSKVCKNISVSDVCVAKDYYTIDETNPSNNKGLNAMALEKDFFQNFAEPLLLDVIATWENLGNRLLTDSIPVESIRFSEEQRINLALCAFIQYHRCPRIRHQVESVNTVIKLPSQIFSTREGTTG